MIRSIVVIGVLGIAGALAGCVVAGPPYGGYGYGGGYSSGYYAPGYYAPGYYAGPTVGVGFGWHDWHH